MYQYISAQYDKCIQIRIHMVNVLKFQTLVVACQKQENRKTAQTHTRLQSDQRIHCLLFRHLFCEFKSCKPTFFFNRKRKCSKLLIIYRKSLTQFSRTRAQKFINICGKTSSAQNCTVLIALSACIFPRPQKGSPCLLNYLLIRTVVLGL